MASHSNGGRRAPPERLDAVQALIGECWPHGKITAVLAAKWGVSRRTIENHIRTVYDRMAEDAHEHRATRKDRLRAALEDLYSRAKSAGQYGAAVTALDRLGKIDGCFVERVELSGPGGAPVELSIDGARKALADRLAARLKGG